MLYYVDDTIYSDVDDSDLVYENRDFSGPYYILRRGTLDLDKLTVDEAVSELKVRVEALFDWYLADSTKEGCLTVAINLAMKYHPAFKVQKAGLLPVSGRPISDRRWSIRKAILDLIEVLKAEAIMQGEKPEGLDVEACRQVHDKMLADETTARRLIRGHPTLKINKALVAPPSVKTMQSYLKMGIPAPRGVSHHRFWILQKLIRACGKTRHWKMPISKMD
jgi:hypothetical protein